MVGIAAIFAMEDIEKDEYIIEYVGKIEYKRTENNYIMKISGMNLWIYGEKWWTGTIHQSLVQSKL
jgi:hypothetical protein